MIIPASEILNGNLTHFASLSPNTESEKLVHYIASGLIGKHEYALNGLEQLPSSTDKCFYTGVIHWIQGNNQLAEELLTLCHDNEHAKNLLQFIRKPKIKILSNLDRGSWACVIDAIKNDSKFEISNIGFKPGDLSFHPNASIHDYYDPKNPPDFYVTKMLEWHLLPKDIQELPCPTIAQTADYDLHIQGMFPWLNAFDELIIDQEWTDMSALSTTTPVTFPKAHPLLAAASKKERPNQPRDIDIFISGTTFHPYHPDKSKLLNQILELSGLKIVFVDGFLNTDQYLYLLSRSKICITYIRRPGMPSRGLEAIAMGCAVLLQEHSSLLLFLKENEGIYTYNENNLEQKIHSILNQWQEVKTGIDLASDKIRTLFDATNMASQYFRFLTYLAAKPRKARIQAPKSAFIHKRFILLKGWLQHPDVYKVLRNDAMIRLENARSSSSLKPCHFIDAAREFVLEYASLSHPEYASEFKRIFGIHEAPDSAIYSEAISIYQQGIDQFPKSLVLRLNFIRTALLFGNQSDVNKAIILAQETLSQDAMFWEVDPFDDVFSWDYFSNYFNYRAYFDHVTNSLKGMQTSLSPLIHLILASIHYHLSYFCDELHNAESAYQFDPTFSFYQFRYARLLSNHPEVSKQNLAADHFYELSRYSMLTKDACAYLLELCKRNTYATRYQSQAIGKWKTMDLSIISAQGGYQYGGVKFGDVPFQILQQKNVENTEPKSLTNSDSKTKILYLPLEFSTWQNAKYWSYSISWGLEAALLAEGVDCFTIPSMQDVPPDDPTSWLHYLEEICAGKTFDQIWFTANHAPLNDHILQWIKKSAPVRVGLFCESLAITQEEWTKNPATSQKRQTIVERSMSVITHAIVVDEGDLSFMQEKSIPAFWFPPCVTADSVCSQIPDQSASMQAVFYGAVYGKRKAFLEHPLLKNILVRPEQSLEEQTDIPAAYDKLQRTIRESLLKPEMRSEAMLRKYIELHRTLRKSCYALWIKTLEMAPVVVNLPQFGFMYSGRIAEAMAAGRPVISWKIPNRKLTQLLFDEGKEIILFDQDNPGQLAAQIHDLIQTPWKASQLAARAKTKLLANFTTEKQVHDILHWIKNPTETPMQKGSTMPTIRLHLGCGEQYLEGYTNIDYPGTEHSVMNVKADEYADITSLQYEANSVDEIRLHHVFEHFQRTTALGLLIRWHEWLKPGGKLVIETPDLEGSAKIFLSNQPWEIKAATVRHLAGDHSDKWAIHVDHWSSERFQHTLKALGFADVQTTASNWAHPPYLANVTAVATKGKNLSRDELLLAADSILWESTVSPVEQKSYQIWRGQLRNFLSPQPPKSQPVESKYTLEEIHNFNQRNRDRWIAQRAIQVPTGASVLDVGAGTCPYRSLFRHCNYKTHDFKKYTGEKLGGTNQYGEIDYVSEITAIPVEDQTFDVILCTEVLEHVPEPGLAIQEMARILKPGGRLILSAPLGSGLHQLPFHYYGGFSPEWYRYHANKLGLSVVEISPNGGFFRQLAQECHRAAGMISSLPQAADFRSPETLKLLAETLPQQFFAIEDSVLVDQFTVGYHVELKKP